MEVMDDIILKGRRVFNPLASHIEETLNKILFYVKARKQKFNLLSYFLYETIRLI